MRKPFLVFVGLAFALAFSFQPQSAKAQREEIADVILQANQAADAAKAQWDAKTWEELKRDADWELKQLKAIARELEKQAKSIKRLREKASSNDPATYTDGLFLASGSLSDELNTLKLLTQVAEAEIRISKNLKDPRKLAKDIALTRKIQIGSEDAYESYRYLLEEVPKEDLNRQVLRYFAASLAAYKLEAESTILTLLEDGTIEGVSVRYSNLRSDWAIQVYVRWVPLEQQEEQSKKTDAIPFPDYEGVPVQIWVSAPLIPASSGSSANSGASASTIKGRPCKSYWPASMVPNGGSNPAHSSHTEIYRCLDFSR
ncbi:MAG: hypothetical protein HY402_06435 [Elusimicrobia bacterium]|nr:hypothetical protein [Elusimicrobiota bacterium]